MTESLPGKRAEQVLFIEDSAALTAMLREHGFDVSRWGEGPTKPVEALWDEVAQGESQIVEVDGELVRRTAVAAVDVVAQLLDGSRYRLREDRHVYRNGSVRQRALISSLAEKIKPEESAETAVRRAIKEELGVESPAAITMKGRQLLAKTSHTFGGMRTELEMELAEVRLANGDFQPEGYVEHQDDKSVYFVWDRIA